MCTKSLGANYTTRSYRRARAHDRVSIVRQLTASVVHATPSPPHAQDRYRRSQSGALHFYLISRLLIAQPNLREDRHLN